MPGLRVLGTQDDAEWLAAVRRMPRHDLTHLPAFARVYEDKGDGVAACLVYDSAAGTVVYPHIRRPLCGLPFSHPYGGHCDMVTPYGYGGPLHDAADAVTAARLLGDFRTAVSDYAGEHRVVSEFIRFHPLLQNHAGHEGLLRSLFLHQENVLVDLRANDQQRLLDYRESYRHCIRQARRAGLEVSLSDPRIDGEVFARLYRETMRRHGQTGYLDLPASFFSDLFARLGRNALLFCVRKGDEIAAAGVFLRHGDNLDYFLSASNTGLLPFHPNHLLLHEVACWARAQGLLTLHLGGGRPSLVFFKSGFGGGRAPYFIGQHVHDDAAYAGLTAARSAADPDFQPSGFFPVYRKGLE